MNSEIRCLVSARVTLVLVLLGVQLMQVRGPLWSQDEDRRKRVGQDRPVKKAKDLKASEVQRPAVAVRKKNVEPSTTREGSQEKENPKSVEGNSASFDPLQANGVLNQIAGPLAKILKLNRKGGRLVFDLPSSYSVADQAFREIRTKARGGGGGHGSGNFWTQYVSGQNFGGRIRKGEQNFGQKKKRPDSFVVEFAESVDRNSELEVQGETGEEFMIRINGGQAPYLMQIMQTREGFLVQEVRGQESFAGFGSSFEEFCRKYPEFVQTRLIAILKKYGFGSPVTRFNPVTRDHVMVLLSPVDDELLLNFRKEFEGLESREYEVREEASAKLNREFEKWKKALRYASGSERFSVEVRARIQKLIRDRSSEEDRQLIGLINSADLVNDREYLVWLLSQSENDGQKGSVAKRLKLITGEDFGTDLAAWSRWLARELPAKPTVVATQQKPLVEVDGYLPGMAQPTANLLMLQLTDGHLSLDRGSWAEQFQGESIKTLVTRLRDQLKKSNLPARWLQSGGNSLDLMRHEHVLFEHIQTAIPPRKSPNQYSYGNIAGYHRSSLNRHVEQPHLFMRLVLEGQVLDKKNGSPKAATNKPNTFHYSIRERQDTNLTLTFHESDESELNLLIASRQAQTVFQLFQDGEGRVNCHLLVGGERKSVGANSFSELYAQYREWFSGNVYPLFARFGIQIPAEIGGPLDVQKAPDNSAKTLQKKRQIAR